MTDYWFGTETEKDDIRFRRLLWIIVIGGLITTLLIIEAYWVY